MRIALKHIATIQTGVYGKTVSQGEIVYLQAKHFDEGGKLHSTPLPDLKSDSITERHMLKPGDVLFAAKGTKNFAAVYEEHNPPAVASTSFFVIRLMGKNILPEFLSWLINHPSTQRILKGKAIGTAIVSISKVTLEELEISIPPVETQQAILKINSLQKLERSIQKQIDELKEQYIQQLLLNALK
jgi:membrane-associated protease RseP (regulator of RpoE activity)